MILGIEIGGTKLQLGVSEMPGTLAEIVRRPVDRAAGSDGILDQIAEAGAMLVERHPVTAIGVGFGGPVDRQAGIVIKSHHVEGWQGFPLAEWINDTLSIRPVIENDCNVASLAEARFGAGEGYRSVLYVTVGTGIGGGLVVDGKIYGGDRPTVAELGHLRPEPFSNPELIVESFASGLSIAERALSALGDGRTSSLAEYGDSLTAEHVASAALDGDTLGQEILDRATDTLGWAIGQVVNIMSPEVIVIGGGVSQMARKLFLDPVRHAARRYTMEALRDSYQVVLSALGEAVVVYGAVALASDEVLV